MLSILSLASCALGLVLICAGARARPAIAALEATGGALLLMGLAILGAALGAGLPVIR
jgi:hypothetical protein